MWVVSCWGSGGGDRLLSGLRDSTVVLEYRTSAAVVVVAEVAEVIDAVW